MLPTKSSADTVEARIRCSTEVLREFLPGSVIDIVSAYQGLALEVLVRNDAGEVVDSETNRNILEAILDVLTNPKSDRSAIRKILQNAGRHGYIKTINRVMDLARDLDGRRLCIDRADLSGLNLAGLDLTNVSARGVNFTGAVLKHVRLAKADVTGSRFPDGHISKLSLTSESIVRGTRFERLKLVDIIKVRLPNGVDLYIFC